MKLAITKIFLRYLPTTGRQEHDYGEFNGLLLKNKQL